MNRKMICVFFSLFTALTAVQAQSADPVILSYQRNFIRASMSTKLELLNDASRITTVNMTPLYIDALGFVMANFPYLGNDQQLMDIAVVSAGKAIAYKDVSVLPSLRAVFAGIPESRVKIACLNAFGFLAYKRTEEISMLNEWLSQNLGTSSDTRTLAACATALGKTGDASSFSVLFAAATGNYDSSVVSAAKAALASLDEGYADNILAILDSKNVKNMHAAFSLAMIKENLSSGDRGKIAERAFSLSTEMIASDSVVPESDILIAVIKDSMAELTALSWSQASPSVVKYFYFLQKGAMGSASGMEAIIPVVKCMGAMGTTDAAQALSIYLGLLNSETEQKKTYNEQLMLAVIQALGDLGDKSAFDYLLYVGYLDYPETVKKASRDALARLAW